jgi:HSP20 family molecular chaperone IbpA
MRGQGNGAQKFQPELAADERQVLHEQGAYSSGRSWKLGHLCLTDKRLLFGHLHRQFLAIELARVTNLRLEKKAFVLASKPCLVLSYRDGASGNRREAWLLTGHIEPWRCALARLLAERGIELHEACPPASEDMTDRGPKHALAGSRLDGVRAAGSGAEVAQARRDRVREIVAAIYGKDKTGRLQPQDIAEVVSLVDRGSARMLWHFWKNRHYQLGELKTMLGEPSHMNVLIRIREVINPAARAVLGKPLLVFERSRMDHQTGEHVLSSWWLNEDRPGETPETAEFVDVLEEEDHCLVLIELPGVEEENIGLNTTAGRLTVSVDTPDHRYHEEIPLPAGADPGRYSASYRNGILQIKIDKG